VQAAAAVTFRIAFPDRTSTTILGLVRRLYALFENMQSVLKRHFYVSKQDGERLNLRDALASAHL
jgi:hypothetical protein